MDGCWRVCLNWCKWGMDMYLGFCDGWVLKVWVELGVGLDQFFGNNCVPGCASVVVSVDGINGIG